MASNTNTATEDATAQIPESTWNQNPLRSMLFEDIRSKRITPEMKPAEAKTVRPEYFAMDKTLWASRLRGARNSIANEGDPGKQKKKKEKWNKKNPVRQLLHSDLANDVILQTATPEDAYKSRPIYMKTMDFKSFKSRFLSMVGIVAKKKERAKEDAEDLAHDLLLHPRPTHNARGEPEWNLHEAADLLIYDLDNGMYPDNTPEAIYNSRLQYKDFTLSTFRGHMHQELHTRKWRDQWVDGRKEYALVNPPTTSNE